MFVLNTSIKSSFFLFKDRIVENLSAQHKKMAVIVSVIFAAITACAFSAYFYFKSRKVLVKEETIQSFTDGKSTRLFQKTLSLSSALEKSKRKESAPPSSVIDEEGSDEDINNENDDWDDDVGTEGKFEEQDLDAADREAEFAYLDPKATYQIDGKTVSLRTFKCLQKLKAELAKLGKEYGEAIDNGDCFWDAFAQRLSVLLEREITIKELRTTVSDEVQRLDRGPAKENWIKATFKGDSMDTYEKYRDTVRYSAEESGHPIFGMPARDGEILARFYKINLKIYEVGCLDASLAKMNDEKNFYSGVLNIPTEQPYAETVEMALYPGHFVPVRRKI